MLMQVILDKNPSIKTVVNKVGNIENEYRVLPLEVVAGKDTLEATIVQHKARFMLNYSEVSHFTADHLVVNRRCTRSCSEGMDLF